MDAAYILGAIVGSVVSESIVGSIAAGSVIGTILAICGAIKHKIGLAIGGFFACLAAHFILGLILSIPTCSVFLFLIFQKKKKKQVVEETTDAQEPSFFSGAS